MKKSNKVLCYIEQPPPMHGMTYINKIIYDNLKHKKDYYFHNTNFTLGVDEVGNISFKKILKNFKIIFSSWKTFFEAKPDVVYSILSATKFGIIRDFMICFMAIIFAKKLVLHLHGFTYYKIYSESKVYQFFFDTMMKNTTLIVLCEEQKKLTLDVMNKESAVLHNCLSSESDCENFKNKILKLCYISNISKAKGTFDLVKAVLLMPIEVELTVAGNFLDDEEEFLVLIDEKTNIDYIGFADEETKNRILKNSDIFCLPSKLEEGAPISIIEALSFALPVLSSNKGCIKDMIENVGYLLENDYTSSDIVKGLLDIDKNYNKMSENALLSYKKNYSQERFIEKLEFILNGE